MERSADELIPSRFRRLARGTAGAPEIIAVLLVTIVVWRLALGWDWSAVPTPDPVRDVAPQSGFDWLVLATTVSLGTGYLGFRGRAVAGILTTWTPVVILSAWRLAVSGVLAWPIALASLVFMMSAICLVAAGVGRFGRLRGGRDRAPARRDSGDHPGPGAGVDPALVPDGFDLATGSRVIRPIS
jgi:hypothetical protein